MSKWNCVERGIHAGVPIKNPDRRHHNAGRSCLPCESCGARLRNGAGLDFDAECEECRRETAPSPTVRGDFEIVLDKALAEVRELMVSRHAKYGPGNIARHGELGLLVRLGDKYERLDNNREDLEDESVDDTVDDIIGYGVIWKLWRKGQWPGQALSSQ